MEARRAEITFFSVATNRYLNFWLQQIESAKAFLDKQLRIRFVVLTDDSDSIPQDLLVGTNWDLRVGKIPNEKWPMPTLFKFKHLVNHQHLIESEIIWQLDADMLFADWGVLDVIAKHSISNEVSLVQHPGYYRSKEKLGLYTRNPRVLLSDAKSMLENGGIGTWEDNQQSLAYVPRHLRNVYVCGGSWGGPTGAVIHMAQVLSARIEQDLSRNVIARFHDESHINWFAATYKINLLRPDLCFDSSYPNLKGITPRILAVDKNSQSAWIRDE